MNKKAVLVIDHKDRDLRGIVLIAYKLYTKYKVYPYLTTTKNEISSLIKYQPDFILLQHVRHPRQKEFLDYARGKNIKIGLLLAEGFPKTAKDIFSSAGLKEFIYYLDLIMLWGKALFNNAESKNIYKPKLKVKAVGSPRFDFHTEVFKNSFLNKSEFSFELGLKEKLPIVVLMTNYKYANREGGIKNLIQQVKTPGSSDHRLASVIGPKARDHQKLFSIINKYYLMLIKDFPKVHFLIKVHPAEPNSIYHKIYNNHKNVRILGDDNEKISLSDIIRNADIEITSRCTTTAESFIMDVTKNIIGINLNNKNLELNEFEYLERGTDLVSNYQELKDRVEFYLEGNSTSETLIEKRIQFISEFLYSNDGNSADRCAQAINDMINLFKRSRSYTITSTRIFLRHLIQYKFNSKWTSFNRPPKHPKYISKEDVNKIANICEKTFGEKMEYTFL